MQAKSFQYYIQNPKGLKAEHVKELQQLVQDFPYFQAANILLSLASKKWDASVYQKSLKKTAIVASNRSHLFKLIHQLESREEDITVEVAPQEALENKHQSSEKTKQELNILKETEVQAEEIQEVKVEKTEPEHMLEKEIQNKVVTAFVEKEILKTPDLNKSVQTQAAPENFSEWLALMKKNNGQPLSKEMISEFAKENSPEAQNEAQNASKSDSNSAQTEEKESIEARKQKNREIMDKIIEKSPGLIRQKEDQKFYTPDIKAKESLIENEHLVTETLAKIYALQGNISKAIRSYEILSLKYPQKSAYFAALIQKLKNN